MKGLDKKSLAYQKYVKPVKAREKAEKIRARKLWWSSNWIALVSLFVSVIALIVSLIK